MPQENQRHRGTTIYRSTHPQQKKNETEKSSYGLDRLQKSLRYVPPKLDTTLSQMYKIPDQIVQFIEMTKQTWRVELTAGGQSLAGEKIQSGIFHVLSLLLFVTDMKPFNHILRKCTDGYELSKSQEKITHLMYMDNIKLLPKMKKNWKPLHKLRIYSQDIGMEFGIEKYTMLVMKRGKQHIMEGVKLPNQVVIRMFGEKETYKYLGILEADTIKQQEWKEKIKKEYLRRA